MAALEELGRAPPSTLVERNEAAERIFRLVGMCIVGEPFTVIPFAADVFTWPADKPQLIGSRCGSCEAVTFPAQASCPRCGAVAMERHLLPRRGKIWSWTTQEFLPKEPYAGGETAETFKPFGVGLVQLEDEVRVEARLTENDPTKLHIGGEVELTIIPFRTEGQTQVVTFAFKPV